ncbi:MAG: tRNA (adenosine(37)-N6)-threonylcarbamoyltransferase complex transferase subunit TsaD [Bacteroidales bacterium]|nr:tRNA (adenosine(37)-N6)-threonylcarbamoyltransferase complex transferase subunit TsaD [Bacteroidales bacterium]MCB8998490.1 tRNA (adenosine(37)-N6)-threonylcarbamoyltransferase complex transferase subunit TsaD [Bacteroidales bacterium]MCB9012931.1 tRNA (adenosine(37)-N6)-threonylcarbamoyltransferase complex transferase subunit TsaD [Bacteroidales bacterium]
MSITILGIESSCDDTAAAVIRDGKLLSSVIANQDVHIQYGGVVPELASRAHQQNIVPVVDAALKKASVRAEDISAVAFTRGPGLLGSLLVGTSFAKGFALVRNIPLVEVHHLQAHIHVHFIEEEGKVHEKPEFPFLCLLVSGGHTQIVLIRDYLDMEIIGKTIDDAAGEAFDKSAKLMGLPYPGGPYIDKFAKLGDPDKFSFSKPRIDGLDYSFSGLKTSILYFLRDQQKINPEFIEENKNDLCAGIQKTIVDILLLKLLKASEETGIKNIALAGGVSANSGLRDRIILEGTNRNWKVYIPEFRFTTDNAAMIAITGYHKFGKGIFAPSDVSPLARMDF